MANRDIKFRAWDGCRMYPVDIIEGWGIAAKGNIHGGLMQYTGLKDKNGVEIYEGDIVNYHNGTIRDSASEEWRDNITKFVVGDICDLQRFTFTHVSETSLEVIGNIYQNPELLDTTGANDE